MIDEILTPEQVAMLLGISVPEVKRMMKDGVIRARMTNRQWRCTYSDVVEYVKNVTGPYIVQGKEKERQA